MTGLDDLYNRVAKKTLQIRKQVKDENAKIISGILPLERELALRSLKYIRRLYQKGSINEDSLNQFWIKLRKFTLNY